MFGFKGWKPPGVLFNLKRGQRLHGFKTGLESAYGNSFAGALTLSMPFAVYNASQAGRGKTVSTGVSSFAGMTLGAIPGAMLAGGVGAFISQAMLSGPIESTVRRGFDWIQKRSDRRPRMGGNYMDFDAAYTMRQVAAREIATSLINARPYLGKEGALMHQ